jgi:NDP-sugar pyrophosphorylase family protein
LRVGHGVDKASATGEWIGLLYVREKKAEALVELLERLAKEEPDTLAKGDLPSLVNRLIANGETVSVVHTYGHWYDLDDQKDLLLASTRVQS